MLHWFACRLKEVHEKDERGEKGFTLIELLVVVIIIGILAAIAIPVFLNQRNKGWDAQAQSDVRNMALAEETYFTQNGTYIGSTTPQSDANFTNNGYKKSADVTAQSATGNTTTYCVEATSKSTSVFHQRQSDAAPQPGACTAATTTQ